MTIKVELLAIQSASADGLLHAEAAVEWAAKHPESELHGSIEWDDTKAALEHRLWQVRRLIQIYIVTDDGAAQMVSLSIDRTNGGGYRSVSDVVAAPDLRAIMLADALAELQRVQVKYARVQELAAVWDEAERVRQRQEKRSARKKVVAKSARKPVVTRQQRRRAA